MRPGARRDRLQSSRQGGATPSQPTNLPWTRKGILDIRSRLEPFPFRLNRSGALDSCFDAFSSREPVSYSLENALAAQKFFLTRSRP